MLRRYLIITMLLAVVTAGWAQEATPTPEVSATPEISATATPEPSPTPEVEATPEAVQPIPGVLDPRATVEGFLNDMDQAGPLRPDLYLAASRKYLDLSSFSTVVRDEQGIAAARALYNVLLAGTLRLHDVPTETDDDVVLVYRQPSGDSITLARQPDGSWLFSKDTVEAAARMRTVLEEKGRISTLPVPYWLEWHFLLSGIQWAGLVLLALLAYVVGRAVVLSLRGLLRRSLSGQKFGMEIEEQKAALRPLGFLVASIIFWAVLPILELPSGLLVISAVVIKLVGASAAVLSAYRFSDVMALYLSNTATGTETKFDDMLVPLARRTLKAVITVLGLLFVAQNLDIEVWSLFAGFSVVGAMVALAGQDLVKNFFGSLTVLVDQPFSVGDWISVEGIEGVVEDVGFRSTRIRTFYDSVISLPNSRLITAHVDNFGARSYRRYSKKIPVAFDTPPEKVEAFCEGIRELIRRHPYTRKDSFQVWLNDFSEFSLQILLYVFFRCPDWNVELRERHRLILDIFRLARSLEVEIPYPASQVHLLRGKHGYPEDSFTFEVKEEMHQRARELGGELVEKGHGEELRAGS